MATALSCLCRLPTRPTLPQDQQQPEAALWHLSRPVRITFTAHETQHETKCVTSVRYHSSFFTCKFVLILTLSSSSCRAEVWLVFSAASLDNRGYSGWHAGCCSSVTLTGEFLQYLNSKQSLGSDCQPSVSLRLLKLNSKKTKLFLLWKVPDLLFDVSSFSRGQQPMCHSGLHPLLLTIKNQIHLQICLFFTPCWSPINHRFQILQLKSFMPSSPSSSTASCLLSLPDLWTSCSMFSRRHISPPPLRLT